MQEIPQSYITILSILVAIIAIIYNRGNLKITKYIDTITSERIKWLDIIRTEVSDIVTNINITLKIYSDTIRKNIAEGKDCETNFDDEFEKQLSYFDALTSNALGKEKSIWSLSDFIKKLYLFKLRLNSIENKEVVEIIDYFIVFYKDSHYKKESEILKAKEKIEDLIFSVQKILKSEWEKCKKETKNESCNFYYNMKKIILISLTITFSLMLNVSNAQERDPNFWITNGPVYTIATDDSYIYIGGSFDYVGPNLGYGAKLSTFNSSPDMDFPKVEGIINTVVSDENGGWYIGGDFTMVGSYARNRIAHIKADKSVDTIWNPNVNDDGSNGYVNTIAISGSDIYVGGEFTSIGGRTKNNIAKLNNTNGNADINWNPNADGEVKTICISGSDIYVGGSFGYIGGQNRSYIAKLNNTNGNADASWNPNANGGYVYSIAINGSDIYVGGKFTSIGGQTRYSIAKLNNSNGNADALWIPDANSYVYTIAISGSDIYVGGQFTYIDYQTKKYIAKLDNIYGNADASWNPNADTTVHSIAISGSDIYVGGEFDSIGGQLRNYIAKLNNTNGNADDSWDPNASGYVNSIAISESNIYVGGKFTSIGRQARKNIAKLNNSNGNADALWIPDANSYVYSIAISGSDIYVGGDFLTIGGQTRQRIAKLNNTNGNADATWSPNANSYVRSITINESDIYVGGYFTNIGGQTRNYIAKLNNANGNADATWNPNAYYDAYNDAYVNTIAINGSDIYVGGYFTSIGGQIRNNIAKLNNTNGNADASWNPNASGYVNSIAISESDIYVGGYFTSIGGQTRNLIAKLNNTNGNVDATWNPYISSSDYTVNSIAINGNDIYAGGDFSTIGGQHRDNIAKLNNTNGNVDAIWSPNAFCVNSIAINGSNIYIGGFNYIYEPIGILKLSAGIPTTINDEIDKNQNINVYPSPANSKITIETTETEKQSALSIYNINGQEIIKQQITSGKTQMDVSNLPKGIYFIKIINDKESFVKKIVME